MKNYGIHRVFLQSEFEKFLKDQKIEKIYIHQGIDRLSGVNSHVYDNHELLCKFKVDE